MKLALRGLPETPGVDDTAGEPTGTANVAQLGDNDAGGGYLGVVRTLTALLCLAAMSSYGRTSLSNADSACAVSEICSNRQMLHSRDWLGHERVFARSHPSDTSCRKYSLSSSVLQWSRTTACNAIFDVELSSASFSQSYMSLALFL